jgi:hypothetical protein
MEPCARGVATSLRTAACEGRLLMATREGTLGVCQCDGTRLKRLWSGELREGTPDPRPAPTWANRW